MSLKRQAALGSYWLGGSGAFNAILQFSQIAVLARFLPPSDFGLAAMVLVVTGLAQTYADMGVSGAIVHRQDTTPKQLSSLYWLNIVAGAAVYLMLMGVSPLIVWYFDQPRLAELIPVMALIFLIAPFGQQFRVLLQKHLRFREIAIVESVAAVGGAVTAVTAALAGHGVYALIFGHLANAACSTLLLMMIGWGEWRPRLWFQRRDLRGYVNFGLFQLGERSINYLAQRLDQILIGALLGPLALGYYNLAYNLVYLPISKINPVLTRVAFPFFAKIQDNNDQLQRGFMLLRRVLATVNFPFLLGLASVASAAIPLLMGDQWLPSVTLLQILAVAAMLRSIGNPIGTVLLAKGRADLGFFWNLFIFVIQIPVIYLGVHLGGSEGVAVAILAAQCCYFGLEYRLLIRPLLGSCFKPYILTMAPAGLTAGAMAVAVLAIGSLTREPTFLFLGVQVLSGVAIYAALNWLLYRRDMREMFRLALGRGA